MDDPILLKQQIEFLQLELDDARCREIQMKSMYESMLKSFSAPVDSPTLSEELKVVKENHLQEVRMLENKQRQVIQGYERKVEDLSNVCCDLEENIKRAQARHEEAITQSRYDLLRLNEEKTRLEYKLNEKAGNEKTIEKLNNEVARLKACLDQQKFVADEEIMQIRENCNRTLEDLRRIYDNEKVGLQRLIDEQHMKIAKLSQGYASEELEEILSMNGSKLDELQMSQSLALEACAALKSFLSSSDSGNSESMAKYSAFIRLLKDHEKTEQRLKETIKLKDQQIISLNKQEAHQNEIIIERDSEILKLKKSIGDLRVEAEGTSKPPVHTPKSKHGRSRTAFQPTENSPGIQIRDSDAPDSDSKPRKSEKTVECEVCKYYISSSKLLDHMASCRLEYELRSPSNYSTSTYEQRFSIEKSENLEKQVNELKLAVGKLKNQRDRARVAGEHLLLHLKNVKLQHAVTSERSGELQLDLKKEIKVLIKHFLTLRSKYPLPLEAISEIDRLVNKSSRFFGGKMTFTKDETQ